MLRWFLASFALAATVSTSTAAYVMNVIPAVAPDRGVNGPTFVAWENNVITGLRNFATGAAAYPHTGDPSQPTFYYPAGTSQSGGAVNALSSPFSGVTGLWNGVANPTGNFTGQSGNWLNFGLAIRTTAGETFRAADVTFSSNSHSGGLITPEVGTGIVGGSNLLFGASTSGGPLFAINGGNATTPLMELYYVGIGKTIVNNAGDYSDPASLEALMLPPLTEAAPLNGTYTLTDAGGVNVLATGTAGVDINSTPAPATIALMGLGLVGLVARVRRRLA